MEESEVKIKELEMKVKELQHQLDNVEKTHSDHLDENDVKALVDQILIEKQYVTNEALENEVSKSYFQLIKWIIGTGISVSALIIGILKFLA